MTSKVWRWVLGLTYILAVAIIWIAASFVVQSVVDSGVSPFLITYICNSLFVVYIPLVEISRYVEDTFGGLRFWRGSKSDSYLEKLDTSEEVVLLEENDLIPKIEASLPSASIEQGEITQKTEFELYESESTLLSELDGVALAETVKVAEAVNNQLDSKGRWTRTRTAKVSLLICPFWFFAQLSFNLSLKYTTVTSNTILSTSSSLFTFFLSLIFLGESFTWVKLISVLLCMGGTIIVSLGDSESGLSAIAANPVLGDILSLVSAGFYAIYITLIRKQLPDEDDKVGRASMAQFLGFLGLFNLLIFLPVALFLHVTKLEPFYTLNWKQFGLVIGKGLLDNVLSDYLWAKAVLLTSTTVATAGLTIQVPLAAVVDSVIGHAPHLMDYIGAAAVMFGFAGINVPSDVCCSSKDASPDEANVNLVLENKDHTIPVSPGSSSMS
ncbi:Solute carrier family 35 member f5 [Thalictrum thalictroides]|uniref:Solute carrier family 35 member f5 n=1 Tax=Thalictrum thalictroides TaxID=46969 RepID=A0A7J6VGJ3_THATH|nr:Solute carrier family 35 member f5 [Thalictrum thalictroides]